MPPTRARTIVTTAVLVAVSILFVLPLVWMISTSLREIGRPLPRRIEWIPDPLAWSNYRTVFDTVDFARYAVNSAIVCLAAVPLTILTASAAGFAISQLSHDWRRRFTGLSFVVMMVPLTAVWLPRFIIYKEAGLIDHLVALVLPAFFGTSPTFVLLYLWAFLRVPAETFDAAKLDGAGTWRVWLGIAMPLTGTTTAAVGMLAFVEFWSDFYEPLIYLQSTSNMTLPLALSALQQLDRTNWPLLMAGAVMVTAPVIAVFIAAQRALLQQQRGGGWLGR